MRALIIGITGFVGPYLAGKPSTWNLCDLKVVELYSMVLGGRTREIVDWFKAPFLRGLKIRAANILSNAALSTMRSIGRKMCT